LLNSISPWQEEQHLAMARRTASDLSIGKKSSLCSKPSSNHSQFALLLSQIYTSFAESSFFECVSGCAELFLEFLIGFPAIPDAFLLLEEGLDLKPILFSFANAHQFQELDPLVL